MRRTWMTCLGILSCVFQLTACEAERAPAVNAAPEPATPPPPMETIDKNGTAYVTPAGWIELVTVANSAKTTFDETGHFHTSRNACGYEAFGKVELEYWNLLADHLNRAATASMVTEEHEYCVAWPSPPGMDGTVELTLAEGKRSLYYARGWEICSLFADHRFSDKLLTLLNEFVRIADKKDCPNGWGG